MKKIEDNIATTDLSNNLDSLNIFGNHGAITLENHRIVGSSFKS